MTFTYEDVQRIVADVSPDGDFNAWLHEIWNFIEHGKRNVCDTNYEIIGFYRLISGLCKLYGGFCEVWNGCEEYYEVYLDIDYLPLLKYVEFAEDSEEDIKDYIRILINENGFSEVRSLLSGVGTNKIFASIYYSMGYEDFSFTDDFDTVMDSIMNDVTADKMAAYEWLREILG